MADKTGEAAARQRFLVALAISGNVTLAARDAEVSRAEMLALKDVDLVFAAAMAEAQAEAIDLLEAEARRRAVEGVEEPIIRGGDFLRHEDGSIAVIRRYSDRLLEFLLKAHRPEIFAARGIGAGHGTKDQNADAGALAPEERVDRVTRVLDAARMRRTRSTAGG